MKRLLFFGLAGIFHLCAMAQNSNSQTFELPALIVDGDTIGLVHIPKVYCFPKMEFTSAESYKKFRRLVRDVKKVYPYAKLARTTLAEVQNNLDSIPSKKMQRKFVKEKEKELLGMYAEELKRFTITQGRILIKLVDRELSRTSYELIKELRGSVSAVMWQGVARLFGESLKETYDAKGEDLMIERIIIMIDQGML